MKKALILLNAAALLLTACAGSGNPSSEGSSQQSSQSSPEAAPVTAEELIEPAMEAYTWCMVYTLLSGGNYVNVDGALYSHDGARGSNIFVGGVTYAMGEETDTRREIIASVEYLVDPAAETPEVEKVEEYTFVQEKIDGKWLFTQFPYFY